MIARNYDERYEEFVNPERTKKQVDFLQEHLGFSSSILDVACGNGRHSVELTKRNYAVIGLDIAEGMILAAKERTSSLGIPFVVGDMVHLPFEDSSFDAAICMWNSLLEVPGAANRKAAIKEMNRVVKHGPIIIDLPNPYWAEISRRKLDREFEFPQGEKGDYWFEEKVGDKGFRVFMHYFSFEEAKDSLDEANLKVKKIYGDYSVDSDFLKTNSEKYIIVAEKG